MAGKISKILIIIAIASLAVFSFLSQKSPIFATCCKAGALGDDTSAVPVLTEGRKYWIGDAYYFNYRFDKKPQMGTIIMKVQVFSKAGKQESSLEITGSADMPSMRGAHSTGEQLFRLNKKGDYLLPVNVVMPGEWEVVLNFFKDKKPVYTGRVMFNV